MKLFNLILSVSLGAQAQNETQWRKPKEFEIVAAYEKASIFLFSVLFLFILLLLFNLIGLKMI